jgi:hypothetical protein
MRWNHPTADEWCDQHGRVVISASMAQSGSYEIKFRRTDHYTWLMDGDIRQFPDLSSAKKAGRALLRELT